MGCCVSLLSQFFLILFKSGDVAALGWWDLFINFGYALSFPFSVEDVFLIMLLVELIMNVINAYVLRAELQSALLFLFVQNGPIQ